jgi:hypothetical protein
MNNYIKPYNVSYSKPQRGNKERKMKKYLKNE